MFWAKIIGMYPKNKGIFVENCRYRSADMITGITSLILLEAAEPEQHDMIEDNNPSWHGPDCPPVMVILGDMALWTLLLEAAGHE